MICTRLYRELNFYLLPPSNYLITLLASRHGPLIWNCPHVYSCPVVKDYSAVMKIMNVITQCKFQLVDVLHPTSSLTPINLVTTQLIPKLARLKGELPVREWIHCQ